MAVSNKDFQQGKRIIELRAKSGISQDELADLIGISRQTMSNIENGADFKVSNFKNLVSALNVSPRQVLFGNEEGKDALIAGINDELIRMEERDLRKLLAGIKAANDVA